MRNHTPRKHFTRSEYSAFTARQAIKEMKRHPSDRGVTDRAQTAIMGYLNMRFGMHRVGRHAHVVVSFTKYINQQTLTN